MKNFITGGLGIFVLVLLVYIFFLRQCGSKTTDCPPKGQMLISKQAYDSIQALLKKPPKIDTVKVKGDIVYISQPTPIAKPELGDSTINNYDTTLCKQDTIDVQVKLKVKGTLLKWDWYYTPMTTTITIEKYVPKIVDNPVPMPKAGLFISVLAGGNKETFLFGGDLDLIMKKNTVIGFVYQRWGNDNLYSVKLGIPIKFRK
jgi:hypothetical protein